MMIPCGESGDALHERCIGALETATSEAVEPQGQDVIRIEEIHTCRSRPSPLDRRMAEVPTQVTHPSSSGIRHRNVLPQDDVEVDDGPNHFRVPGGEGVFGDEASSHSAQPEPAPTPEAPPPPIDDEKQCRICLAGEEEQGELGRLFRPCRCRGSMKVPSNSVTGCCGAHP